MTICERCGVEVKKWYEDPIDNKTVELCRACHVYLIKILKKFMAPKKNIRD